MANLTLEDLEIERNHEPFLFTFPDEDEFDFLPPKGISGSALLDFEQMGTREALQAILGERFEDFMAHDEVDGYFMEALFARYMKHFALGSPGNADASRRSSSGTARRSRPTSRSRG